MLSSVAAANRFVLPYLIHGSLDPLDSACQTASPSVQLFFAGLTRVRNTQTHRPRYVRHLCMRCGIKTGKVTAGYGRGVSNTG